MDSIFLIFCAALVFLMQAGFLCLETGKVRSKNSINVAAKNLSDFILSSIIFWVFGFGVMFGISNWGYFGSSEFFFGAEQSASQVSFFLFQMMFCGTTATLVSGAVAERMSYRGYLLTTLVLCALIYPIVGHWSWASLYNNNNTGWLESLGFYDFAGSTVVHSVGGWVSLAAIIIIGARQGRFNNDVPFPAGSNLPLSALGTLLIWLGWFGFNGGSTLAFNDQVPLILLNTCIAAIFGGLSASAIFYYRNKYIDVGFILNGIIAGLVAVTACANVVLPSSAALLGTIAGVIIVLGEQLLIRCKLDDSLGVVPAHLFAGIWGTLAVAIFHKDIPLLSDEFWHQLFVQCVGVVIIGIYSFTVSWILLRYINIYMPLRVNAEQEYLGMNVTEHRATTESLDLLNSMNNQATGANFSERVPEEPYTEIGQIAHQYNRVIDRVQHEMEQRDLALNDFKSSEKRKSAILNSSMDSIVTINLRGQILEFNPAAERTFGCLHAKVSNKNFVELFVQQEDQEKVTNSLTNRFSESSGLLINRRNTIQLLRVTGDRFPAELTITGTTFGSTISNEFTLHIRDVTRQRRLQEKLRQLAYSDPLTGLYNRTYFLDALKMAIPQLKNPQESVTLFFLDLDRFKKINDTLGHKAGDELLLEVAKRLTNVTRNNDTVGRWGGDEFVIMMTGRHDKNSVISHATKILQVMRESVILSGNELRIPTSIGISITNDPTISPATLIQQADIAMYHAKKAGRDNFKLFTSSMAQQASENFDAEQSLNQSLNDGKAIVIYYQPKVDSNEQLTGLEALVRLRSAHNEIIPPSAFIPLAEESGQIVRLEQLIIQNVFEQIALWRTSFYSMPTVSINLSGIHLLSDDFLNFIEQKISLYGILGEWIEFEVTEGVFLNDIEKCIAVLKQLQALNIAISIDDFGTGYSSLNYLKALPVDVLKIDRAFVNECATVKEDAKICSTIIELAQSLDLRTVAEGVENQAQLEFLSDNGCNEFQGFYFYRPLTCEQTTQLLLENQDKASLRIYETSACT